MNPPNKRQKRQPTPADVGKLNLYVGHNGVLGINYKIIAGTKVKQFLHARTVLQRQCGNFLKKDKIILQM